MKRVFLLACLALTVAGQAQTVSDFVQQAKPKWLEEYVRFLSIPNVASDSVNIRKNAAFIQDMMVRRGITSRLLQGTTPGVTPAVFGEIRTPGAIGEWWQDRWPFQSR